jgi:radical SAM enzyme (TIGR01210 family)
VRNPPSLARTIALDRRPSPAPPETAGRYVNLWREPEAIGAERVTAFVAILRTRGCYWADGKGCSMCGYAKDTLGRSATPGELSRQLEGILRAYSGEPYVKFYTSGSFLDDREVDPDSRIRIVQAFSGRARRLLFETLPEFVQPGTVTPLKEAFAGDLEIALGLESADPEILGRFVTKGSPPSAYFDAFERARALKVSPKAYLLLKPPYLTEKESVADVVRSVRECAPKVDALSINPVHIQNGTVVEHLFRRGRYRPPWLWSLVDAMRAGSAFRGSTRLVTFPTAGGLPRGPHNCGKCDRAVLDALETASLDQRFEGLESLDCPCRATYESLAALEPLGVEA